MRSVGLKDEITTFLPHWDLERVCVYIGVKDFEVSSTQFGIMYNLA